MQWHHRNYSCTFFFKKVGLLSKKCFSTNYIEHNMNLKVKETWRNLLVMISTWQRKLFKMKSILLFLSPLMFTNLFENLYKKMIKVFFFSKKKKKKKKIFKIFFNYSLLLRIEDIQWVCRILWKTFCTWKRQAASDCKWMENKKY